jgi:hypothetical protein
MFELKPPTYLVINTWGVTHTMELLGDVCHVESYFIPLGDIDNLDAR